MFEVLIFFDVVMFCMGLCDVLWFLDIVVLFDFAWVCFGFGLGR